jgi:outer membrane protein assembly factor BamB
MTRSIFAVLFLLTSTVAAAQTYEYAVAGGEGICVIFTPVITNRLEWTGGTIGNSDIRIVAQAPGGRVYGATFTSQPDVIAEIRPDGSRTPITAPGRSAAAMVVDDAGAIYALTRTSVTTYELVAFNPDGTVRATYPLTGTYMQFPGSVNSESPIDLAADQCTLFLIEGGTTIKRFNVCSGAPLPDFATIPPSAGQGTALRILPDGGVIVVTPVFAQLQRFDANGALVRTYSLPDDGDIALTLRDGGRRVVVGEQDCDAGRLHVIDLESGETVSTVTLRMQVPGSVVSYFGWTAALGDAHASDVPAAGTTALLLLAVSIACLAVMKLR